MVVYFRILKQSVMVVGGVCGRSQLLEDRKEVKKEQRD